MYCSICGQESDKLYETKRIREYGSDSAITIGISLGRSKKHDLTHACFECVSEIVPTQVDDKHIVKIKLC